MAILQRPPPVQFSFWSRRAGLRQSTCFEATAFILTALTAHPTTHIDLPHIGASDNAAAVVSGLSLHKLGRHQHQPPPKCESASVGVGTVNNPTTTTDAASTNAASELYCFWPQKWVKAACCSGVLGPRVKFGSWAGESFQLCIYLQETNHALNESTRWEIRVYAQHSFLSFAIYLQIGLAYLHPHLVIKTLDTQIIGTHNNLEFN